MGDGSSLLEWFGTVALLVWIYAGLELGKLAMCIRRRLEAANEPDPVLCSVREELSKL
jgi:hypothetical protein